MHECLQSLLIMIRLLTFLSSLLRMSVHGRACLSRSSVLSCAIVADSHQAQAHHSMATHLSQHCDLYHQAIHTGLSADYEHELKPVQSGFRLALVYNLVNAGSKSKLIVKDKSRLTSKVADAVKVWSGDANRRKRGIYMLSHKYGIPAPSITFGCAISMCLTAWVASVSAYWGPDAAYIAAAFSTSIPLHTLLPRPPPPPPQPPPRPPCSRTK